MQEEKAKTHLEETFSADYKTVDQLNEGSAFAGHYHINGILGSGGMGRVFRVTHTDINRPFALKVILPERNLNDEDLQRFRNEAQTLHDMRHENIVRIFEYGITPDGKPYQILDFIDGQPLAWHIHNDRKLTFQERLSIAIQLCRGLSHAHHSGVVHRDIKSSNVLIERNDNSVRAILIDFGLAKSEIKDGRTLTRTGDIVGSPAYMSPEQALGHKLDGRSDIFSLGVLLYETFTTEFPFGGESPLEQVMARFHNKPPVGPLNKNVPPHLRDVILHCLEQDRDHRYKNIDDVLLDLESIEKGIKPKVRLRRRLNTIGLVSAGVLLLAAGTGAVVTNINSTHQRNNQADTGPTTEGILHAADKVMEQSYDADQRAYAYFLSKDYAKCIEMLKTGEHELEAMAAEPNRAKNHQNRYILAEKRFFIGQCYYRMNNLEEAAKYMKDAWQEFNTVHALHPNANDCAKEFAEILRKLGRIDEANKVDSDFSTFKSSR